VKTFITEVGHYWNSDDPTKMHALQYKAILVRKHNFIIKNTCEKTIKAVTMKIL
jgi:hypothetical protein